MSVAPRAKTDRFLALHRGAAPLLLPNAWDAGSARMFASLGFDAIATTSSGFAATLGRLDGSVTRDDVLAHSAALVGAVDIPVTADFENGFADSPEGVAENVTLAAATGLAGCSVEDWSGTEIYDAALAAERIAAAVEAGHRGGETFVVCARAENFLHGHPDLDETIARLQSFEAAGADVVYAPGLRDADQIRAVLDAVDLPVNVIALPGVPPVPELAKLGVGRISVGGAFAWVAYGAAAEAARELRDQGTYTYFERAMTGGEVAKAAFTR
jgi:2-methylisocitrate lyase-like PEP mutase family enzyme